MSTIVSQAAKLLDEKVPGWHERVDMKTLNIISPTNCILGQVFRGVKKRPFLDGLSKLGVREGSELENTFADPLYLEDWKEAINARLA